MRLIYAVAVDIADGSAARVRRQVTEALEAAAGPAGAVVDATEHPEADMRQPMKPGELDRFVCVAHGGCLHSPHRTITADGVWVKVRDSLGTHSYSSAHRDCFEAWQAREAGTPA